MFHARPDYNRIQDPEGKIPKDEPVFLIRAQDVTAPFVVEEWARQAERFGAGREMVKSAQNQAIKMRQWQRDHGMKIPDMPQQF